MNSNLKLKFFKKGGVYLAKSRDIDVAEILSNLSNQAFELKDVNSIDYFINLLDKISYVAVGIYAGRIVSYILIRTIQLPGQVDVIYHLSGFGVVGKNKKKGYGGLFLKQVIDSLDIKKVTFHTQNPRVICMLDNYFSLTPDLLSEDFSDFEADSEWFNVWGSNQMVVKDKYTDFLYQEFPFSNNKVLNERVVKLLGAKKTKNAIRFLGKIKGVI